MIGKQNHDRARQIKRNKAEYADRYRQIRWLSGPAAISASLTRRNLLTSLASSAKVVCRGSKIVYGLRSLGCLCCAEGTWSCLFINGTCNAGCFFCPVPQDGLDVPGTNNIPFADTSDYLDYVQRMGIKGVGISGGEPLLSPDKTFAFITALKKRFGTKLYVWMYTNGKLMDALSLARLKDAGLDEVRFNILAGGYALGAVPAAVRAIPTVTVEIPAVPEDLQTMKTVMRQLSDKGVQHLNLHQLRLTPHNFERLIRRRYTFLHGEKVTVLESELTALRLLEHAARAKLPLAVNYCSFVYKNRYQALAARRRAAHAVKKSYEDLTDNGYIRYLFLTEDGTAGPQQRPALELLREVLTRDHPDAGWQMKDRRLYLSASLLPGLDLNGTRMFVSYCETRLMPELSYYYPFEEIRLNPSRKIVAERIRVSKEIEIGPPERTAFLSVLQAEALPPDLPRTAEWTELSRFEVPAQGLQDYY